MWAIHYNVLFSWCVTLCILHPILHLVTLTCTASGKMHNRQVNSLAYFPFLNYPKIWKFRGKKNEEGKRWLTPSGKSLDASYNNHSGSHVTTEPGLSQGVSHDHAPAACPRACPPAAGPLWWWAGGGGDKSYKASRRRSSCKDQGVPSQAILSAASPVISREWLLSLSSHVAICACRRWLLTGDLFLLLRAKGWVMACCCSCSTFVMRLLFFFNLSVWLGI